MNNKLRKLVSAAMFAAFICVATLLIQIPSPMGGYINFGDCFILASAWVLGPVYGFAAGGIGSALADLISGYAQYVPGTLVIKGLIAVSAAVISKKILTAAPSKKLLAYTSGAVTGELIMIIGYALYDGLIFGSGFFAALCGVGNLVQGVCGAAAGVALIRALSAAGVTRKVHAYAEIF